MLDNARDGERQKPYPRPGVERGKGDLLNLLELCAILVRDRGLTKEQILDLDEFWLCHVYFHPTEKHGSIAVRPKKPRRKMLTEYEVWRNERKKLWWPDWYIEEEWRLHIDRKQDGKKKTKPGKRK